jgi:hypothetical protein
MTTQVKRDGGQVWIEGVPTLGWGKRKECTFAGALEAASAPTPHPCKYEDVMAWTGLAFRVRWFRTHDGKGWCPSSPVGEFDEEIDAAQKATGWRFRVEARMDRQNAPHMENLAPDIAASIDAGRPVLAYAEQLNMDVIYGYADGGKTFLLRGYFKGEQPLVLKAAEIGPMALFLKEHIAPPARRAALADGLRIAVRNARRAGEPFHGVKGLYHHGDEALRLWADDLGRVDGLDEKQRENLFFVSWWCFDALWDARRSAADFLAAEAATVDGEARAALERAAGLYRREADRCAAAFRARDAFLGPWTGKAIGDWTPEVRGRERQILGELRRLDAAAVADLEKALAALK